jgi:hypothetical protein
VARNQKLSTWALHRATSQSISSARELTGTNRPRSVLKVILAVVPMPPLLCTDNGRTKRKIIVLKIDGRLPPIMKDVEAEKDVYVHCTRAVLV